MNRLLMLFLAVLVLSLPAIARAESPEGLPENPPAASATATAKDDVKGLSWFEISTFSPGLHPVDEAFVKRMDVTWKMKLRAFRRNAQFAAMLSFDPALKAQWKKIAEECTRIIKTK